MKNKFLGRNAKVSAIIAVLAVTGCAEYNRLILDTIPENGTEFTRTLAVEYETLGNTEQNIMYDEISADYYYRKAICAREGFPIGPTPLEKWDLECDMVPELAAARARLLRAIDFGSRNIAPKMTAYAQAHFDCWAEQQAEGWQVDDIALCRSEFYYSMAEVELMLMGGAQQVIPANMVFFDFNSSLLTPEALNVIGAVGEMASAENPHHILLIGRTDRIGDSKHNKDLSKNRALAVKEELVRWGVPPQLISIKAAGETPGPKVDGHNRRVDIIFLNY